MPSGRLQNHDGVLCVALNFNYMESIIYFMQKKCNVYLTVGSIQYVLLNAVYNISISYHFERGPCSFNKGKP